MDTAKALHTWWAELKNGIRFPFFKTTSMYTEDEIFNKLPKRGVDLLFPTLGGGPRNLEGCLTFEHAGTKFIQAAPSDVKVWVEVGPPAAVRLNLSDRIAISATEE